MIVKSILPAVGLLAALFAGCFDEEPVCHPEDCDLNHILLLHDITYHWNESAKQLSGHFILSNLHPDPNDHDKDVWLKILLITGRFDQTGGPWGVWHLGYDDYQHIVVRPGESMVFNYTFPQQKRFKQDHIDWTPDTIKLDMQGRYVYKDEANVRDDNPNGYVDMNHDFQNNCLRVVDAVVVQDTSEWCTPWRGAWEHHSGFFYHIDDYFFPPPDVWPTWTDDSPIPLSTYPQFRKHVKFLQDFDFESANIVYFEGEID